MKGLTQLPLVGIINTQDDEMKSAESKRFTSYVWSLKFAPD